MTKTQRALLGLLIAINLSLCSVLAAWATADGGVLPSLGPLFAGRQAGLATSAPARPLRTPRPASATPLPLVTATPRPSVTPSAADSAATPAAVRDGALALPEAADVQGVEGHRQSLALSCEARSASDWAGFFQVQIDELEFLNSLPLSDDPDRGFVGDVNGEWGQVPPNAYGVHAGPVASRLRSLGLSAYAQRYMDWDTLRAELADGRPVIAWVIGHVEPGEATIYTAADGRRTVVARFEHTVIVIGYDDHDVTIIDGNRRYRRSIARFLESWAVLHNMAITARP